MAAENEKRIVKGLCMDREQAKKKPAKKMSAKPFRFELGWGGMFGLMTVCFCLFLWMFLLGLWAGQTILLPTGNKKMSRTSEQTRQVASRSDPALSNALKPEKH